MAKIKSVYVCQNCGVQSAKWVGKCNSCNEWNTYVEEQVGAPEKELTNWRENNSKTTTSKPIRLKVIPKSELLLMTRS